MLQMANWSPLGLLFTSTVVLLATSVGALKTETRNFGPQFNPSTDAHNFILSNKSGINSGALQITPDTGQPGFDFNDNSGRIFLNQKFTLWDRDFSSNTTKTASFNTTFIINIGKIGGSVQGIGEGMAFIIGPNTSDPPAGSDGQYLGLTSSSTDGNSANHLFAIEFDTQKDGEFDPDSNHIGIDINSIRSDKTVSLSKSGITLATNNSTVSYCKIWIQYDGLNQNISVYIKNLANIYDDVSMPESPDLTMEDLDLSSIVERESYFGFAASTGSNTEELNCVLSWNITVEVIGGGGGGWWRGVAIAAAAVVVVVVAVGAWLLRRRRKEMAEEEKIFRELKSLPGTPKEFEFRVLKTATGNFDEKKRLGEGGYGVVYRGVLPAEKVEVAVKKFTREDNIKGKQDFLSELTIINRLRHKHLVKLLGWCHKNKMLLLVYEYMPNCSLDRHIFCEDQAPLSWNFRYKILNGVALALQYLHHEYDETVIHRDIKASNIMLDANFNARLGDFGLARALEQEKTSYAEMGGFHGTMGYIAPECFHTEKATRESDIYAFGVVLLEVATGHRPWDKLGGFNCLGDWVWSLHRETRIVEAVDSRLGNDYVVEEAERILLLGLACLHPIGSERPNAQAIVQILSGSVPVPSVPPFKPAFVWPSSMGPMMRLDLSIDTNTTTYTTHIVSSSSGNEWTTSYRSPESIDGLIDHSSV